MEELTEEVTEEVTTVITEEPQDLQTLVSQNERLLELAEHSNEYSFSIIVCLAFIVALLFFMIGQRFVMFFKR